MWAARWLAVSLTLALTKAEGDSIVPGVKEQHFRPKRQGVPIIFPDSFEPSPRFPDTGPGRFAPHPPPPSGGALPEDALPDLEDGPDTALELPDDMDLNTMDRNSLSRINSIDNIMAFADLFGIDLPANEESDLGFAVVSRFASTEGPAEMATMATCKPEIRTVELDLPVEPNTLFYPTCVRLEQCGGCCYGPLLTCRPKTTKVVKLKVLKTVVGRTNSIGSARSRGNSRRQRGRRRRRRRESIPSFHEVEAIKHVQCECGCKVQAQDCNLAIHNYLESECACVCKRGDEKKKCEQQNDTKYWDNDSCACYCRRSVDCSTGEFFSQDSCKCERLVARAGFPVDAVEDHIERRRRPFERPHRRRPVRIPLRPDERPNEPLFSRRPTLLSMLHAPRHEPAP